MRTFTTLSIRHLILATAAGLMLAPVVDDAHAQEFPPDAAKGKAVYERHCLACHGAGGRGDGPDAAGLTVPPANFHRFKSFLKSDEELLRTIEHGVVFSPMHAWQGQLTETERQDALAYIRLLVQQGK
ncbi:MAG: cytochrome c [Nitrospira sp.]|nr:cytochrome c [Nitrospira sp.]MBX7038193.1 cytochrome c [Nitrospira sp.]MCW5794527.1 cytochrome c [Nitrospira sp.]HMU28589.1 cytochrome c [Nitrospira sp.]HNI18653.1 cytochrome c [Nitrospira sp.]